MSENIEFKTQNSLPKLFGMDVIRGRWIYVLLGFAINLCLGAIYSWSVFRKPLQDLFSVGATESLLPFTVFLVMLAVMMLVSGEPLDRFGPRKLAILGGILVGMGWFLGGMVTDIRMLTLTYGVIGGSGVGIVFNCPIGIASKWFPEKRGLAVGLTLFGFGLSSVLMAPLANVLIQKFGVLQCFSYLGIVFLVALILLALPLSFPPNGWAPPGHVPPPSDGSIDCDISRSQLIRTPTFWAIWICLALGTLIGLMAIGIASSVGQEVFALSAGTSAVFVGIFGFFNGMGRPTFGYLIDRLGSKNTAVINFAIIFLASCLLVFGAGTKSAILYAVVFAAIWLCLGGWVTIAPAATASFFGTRFFGRYYGAVYTAFGVGAVIGTLMAGQVRDLLGSYTPVFVPIAFIALSGTVFALKYFKTPAECVKDDYHSTPHWAERQPVPLLLQIQLSGRRAMTDALSILMSIPRTLEKNAVPSGASIKQKVMQCGGTIQTTETASGELPVQQPVVMGTCEDLLDLSRMNLRAGEVWIDPGRKCPALLDVFSASVRDGLGNTLAERIFVVETAMDGTMHIRQPAIFLELFPADAGTAKPDAPGMPTISGTGSYLSDHGLQQFRDEVTREQQDRTDATKYELRIDSTALNRQLLERLDHLYTRLTNGDKDPLLMAKIQNTHLWLDTLNKRSARRQKELDLKRTCNINNLSHQGRVWVLPPPQQTTSGTRVQVTDDKIDQIALREAILFEEARGWKTETVSGSHRGFNLISRKVHPDDPKTATDIRFILLKSTAAMGEISLTSLEYKTAEHLNREFWLYAVFNCASSKPSLHTVQDPMQMGWQLLTTIEGYRIDPDAILGGELHIIKSFTRYNGGPVTVQALASEMD